MLKQGPDFQVEMSSLFEISEVEITRIDYTSCFFTKYMYGICSWQGASNDCPRRVFSWRNIYIYKKNKIKKQKKKKNTFFFSISLLSGLRHIINSEFVYTAFSSMICAALCEIGSWAYADSEDPDQPAHPRNIIRTFAVRKKNYWIL